MDKVWSYNDYFYLRQTPKLVDLIMKTLVFFRVWCWTVIWVEMQTLWWSSQPRKESILNCLLIEQQPFICKMVGLNRLKRGGSTIGTGWSTDQVYPVLQVKTCGNEEPGRQPVSKWLEQESKWEFTLALKYHK